MLKLVDKLYFMCGVTMSWVFAYCLGRYPRDAFLVLFTILIIPLVFWRWRRYVSIGMHYYLLDLCYFSTGLILYYIWFDRTNEILMRIGFLMSHGCLALSIAAFRNSLVFHDMDCMTSMGIHAAPMIITHHIRWSMIPEEASWPTEQRQFNTISTGLSVSEYLWLNMWYPILFWLCWMAVYWPINFVIAHDRIKTKNYNTLYFWFANQPRWYKWIEAQEWWLGVWSGPVQFFFGHFVFMFTSHLVAMIGFEFYWFNLAVCTFYIGVSQWNGANFYMEFFSKRYETKLAKIEALAGKSLSMEERQKAAWGE